MADDDRMTKAEWEASVQKHNEDAARRVGVLSAGERVVHDAYEAQRPVLDPVTQTLWNDWFDRRYDERFSERAWRFWADEFADVLGTATGKQEREFRDEINKTFVTMRKEFADEIAKVKKEFAAKIVKMRKEVGTRGQNVIDLPQIPLKNKA